MKTMLLYLLYAYCALSLQAIFFKGIKPDLVLVLTCLYSLKYGQIRGMTYGAVSGILIDTVSGIILGPHVVSKSITGFLMGTIKEHLFQWNIFINTVVVLIFSVINILVVYLILETFSRVTFSGRSMEISIMEIIYTTISAIILYPVFRPVQDISGD